MLKKIKKLGVLDTVWHNGLKKLVYHLEHDKPEIIVENIPLTTWIQEARQLCQKLDNNL